MTFHDYYLKFNDAAEAASVIGTVAVPNQPDTLHRSGCDISIIGTMHTQTGNILTDADGMEYYETVPIDGYHVNMRCREEQADLVAYDIAPTTPARVWL